MGAEETLFQRFGKEYPKSTVLFREGEPGKEMFVLQAGKVAISKKVRDVEKVLAILGPGEFFGEPAIRNMIDKLTRSGMIERQGDRVIVYDTARLHDFLQYLEMRWKFGDL